MRYIRINKVNKKISQGSPLDRLGGILRKASGGRVSPTFGHNIGRQSDYGDMGMLVIPLPGADFATGFVAVFVRHLYIALWICY